MLASRDGRLELVTYLVENGADLNARNENNETALNSASLNEHLEVVKYLIEKGADDVNAKNKYDNTALTLYPPKNKKFRND